MDYYLKIVEFIVIFVTLLLFLSGLPPCVEMYNKNSTDNIPFHLFLISVITSIGMFHYGYLQDNSTMMFLNSVGGSLYFCYSLVYLYVSKNKMLPLLLVLLAVVYKIFLYSYLSTFDNDFEYAGKLGSICGVLNTIMMILPGIELIDNIRNKNSNGVPLIMLFGGLMCSTSWLIYGLLLEDPNIYMPNIPGLAITSLKILMHSLYDQRQKSD